MKAAYSTTALHVKDIARSIRFYSLLGFELIDVDGDPAKPGWARMHCEGGAIMFLLAEEPVDPRQQAFFLYMYSEDLPALRQHLLDHGVKVSEIKRPPYMPSGEISVPDPDGYGVFVGHWGDQEHQDWLKRLEEKRKKGVLPPKADA